MGRRSRRRDRDRPAAPAAPDAEYADPEGNVLVLRGSRNVATLERMVTAGMDVARLNFSHGTRETHAETAQRVRTAAERAGRQVAILQDLPGPKLRIGELREGVIELKPGEHLTFQCGSREVGDHDHLPLGWPGLPTAVTAGDVLYLTDASVRLRVTGVRDGEVDTEVERGGTVSPHPGPT